MVNSFVGALGDHGTQTKPMLRTPFGRFLKSWKTNKPHFVNSMFGAFGGHGHGKQTNPILLTPFWCSRRSWKTNNRQHRQHRQTAQTDIYDFLKTFVVAHRTNKEPQNSTKHRRRPSITSPAHLCPQPSFILIPPRPPHNHADAHVSSPPRQRHRP